MSLGQAFGFGVSGAFMFLGFMCLRNAIILFRNRKIADDRLRRLSQQVRLTSAGQGYKQVPLVNFYLAQTNALQQAAQQMAAYQQALGSLGYLGGGGTSANSGNLGFVLPGQYVQMSVSMPIIPTALAIVTDSLVDAERDLDVADTFGWRNWLWDPIEKKLRSPVQRTIWETEELRCEAWSEENCVRGHAGIHAALVPKNWQTATGAEVVPSRGWTKLDEAGHIYQAANIAGIVERFGKFVLGTEGWRAEIVIIRKLHAPNTDMGLELERAYPGVEVCYPKESQ